VSDIAEVSDQNFAVEVLQADRPVLVDFWAVWCVPCRKVAPVVEAIAAGYTGKLKVVKLNVDENHGTAGEYQIRNLPTLALFRDGKLAKRIVGYVPEEELREYLDTVV
jgi:thioredoxin 1